MRKIANDSKSSNGVVRVMIFSGDAGVYLFLYDEIEDGPCSAEYWFESIHEAEDFCVKYFEIAVKDWAEIPNPEPNCQDDWIIPTRRDAWNKFTPVTEV